MKPIRYLDAARREYENQIQFLIQNRSVAHALRFKEEVEKAEAEIQRKPKAFKLIGTYRYYGPTRKEKYRISYVETPAEIVIVAVYFSGVARSPLLARPPDTRAALIARSTAPRTFEALWVTAVPLRTDSARRSISSAVGGGMWP